MYIWKSGIKISWRKELAQILIKIYGSFNFFNCQNFVGFLDSIFILSNFWKIFQMTSFFEIFSKFFSKFSNFITKNFWRSKIAILSFRFLRCFEIFCQNFFTFLIIELWLYNFDNGTHPRILKKVVILNYRDPSRCDVTFLRNFLR